MLTEICAYLKNYFEYDRIIGNIHVSDGVLYCGDQQIGVKEGQYFALFREHFALGVYKYGTDTLEDRDEFRGAVWLMDVPSAVLRADEWAEEWNTTNGGATSEANSPFQSESFGGYSYSKGSVGNTSGGSAIGASVFDEKQFLSMIAPYRKVRL